MNFSKFLRKIFRKKGCNTFMVIAVAFLLFNLIPEPAHAATIEGTLQSLQTGILGIGDLVIGSLIGLFNGILAAIIAIVGWLISFSVDLLQLVASYNSFSTQREVSIMWALVRDVMNSFFIVVLIVIAFATILRWSPWQFKATLPKFIVAAFIVNFSKTICLLFINFSSAIMGTFITAIGDAFPAFVLALRAPATVSFSSDTIGGLFGSFVSAGSRGNGLGTGDLAVSALTTLVSSLFSILILIIAFAAIMMFVFILLWRIIMLWMLIILSPAAFFLWAVPGKGAGYFKQWLDEFVKEVLIGPIIALMLYLDITFFIQNIRKTADGKLYGMDVGTFLSDIPPAILTLIGNPEILFGYIVGLVFIFVSIEIVQKVGSKSVGLGSRTGKFAYNSGFIPLRDKLRHSALKGRLSQVPGIGAVAPFIPWTPVASTGRILDGLKNKQTKWNADSNKAQLKYAADQLEAEKPGRARAFFARLNAGDTELGENLLQEFSGAAGSAASVIPRIEVTKRGSLGIDDKLDKYRQGTSQITGRLATYDAHDKLRSGMDDNMLAKFRYENNESITERLGQLKETESVIAASDRYNQITDNFAKGGVYKTPEERAAATQERDQLEAQLDAYDQKYLDAEQASLASEVDDIGAYEKAAELIDQEAVYQQGVEIGDNVGTIMSKINDNGFKRTQIQNRAKDTNEFLRRKSAAADTLSSIRTDFQKQRLEYIKKEYPVDGDEVDASTIFNRLLSHQSPEDKVLLSGDILQAARQGDAQQVLRQFGESVGKDFSFTSSGMTNLTKHLTESVGLEKDEAIEVIADMQKVNYEDGRLALGDFVKRKGSTGKRELVSEEARAVAIETNLKKKPLIQTLRAGKVDAFGHKDAFGKLQVHAGAIKAVKSQRKQITTILSDSKLAVQIPDNMLKMMEDNAEQFGIADQLGTIQSLRK